MSRRPLEHMLLTPCAKNAWMVALRLHENGFGLHLDDDDIVG